MADKMHVSGDELKKLVKLGKKRAMPFAFCPSAGDDDNVLIVHRKRKPDMLGKIAKKEGEGTKVAFGTFTVKAKDMTLMCEREIGGLAKKLKKHLKADKLPMNIIVCDMSGNVLESDIEDLGPDEDGDDFDDIDDVEEDAIEAAADDPQEDAVIAEVMAEEDPDLAPAALAARIKAAKPKVDALQGDFGVKLTKILGLSVAALKGSKFETADKALASVEAALERLDGVTAPDAPPPPPPGGATPEAIAMVQRINKARAAAEALGGDGAQKILGLLGQAAASVRGADIPGAAKVVDAVEAALAKAAPKGAEQAQAQPDGDGAPADRTTPEGQKWTGVEAKLMPAVEATLKAGKGDISGLNAAWAVATEKADLGDFAGALAIAPRVMELIRAAQAETQTNVQKDIPADVVPFVQSRLDWGKTRKTLRDELGKLKASIDAVVAGVEGLEDVASQTGVLFDHLNGLDDRLEGALDEIAKTPEGDARTAAKRKARAIISEYEGELETDFFKDVDSNNGFASVAVRSTAVDALKTISAVLA